MPTLTRYRRSNVQVPELARSDVKLKDMKLSELELPKFDLSKVDLPKVEIPKFERPTPDEVGKAVAGVATAVGLAKARPRRWPYLVVAGLAVAAAGWIAMNWSTTRARIDAVAARAKERMTAVQGDETWDDAVAFTAADTKAIEPSIDPPSIDAVSISSPTLDDYPDGLGIPGEPVGASRS